MPSRCIIRNIVRSSIALSAIAILSSAYAVADGLPRAFPPQPLAEALETFAQVSGLQIVYRAELAAGLKSKGAEAGLSAEQALAAILRDTGLTYTFVNERMVAIRSAASASGKDAHANTLSSIARLNDALSDARSSYSTGFRIAQADSVAPSSEGGDPRVRVEEVIVTAQKRLERLQDVPVPVTAVDAKTLVDNNLLRIQDYYSKMPGLAVSPVTQSGQSLSIRGVTTGPGNPSVGVTVDDVPYGASTQLAGGMIVPDIDPGDLARIEVLRGPQGTLYGASSLGGLLKFVTVDPSTEKFSGDVQAGLSTVSSGDDTGYNVRGAVNVPLSDTFAFRARVFSRRDPGYIDNVQTGQDDINRADAKGARLSAIWRPSETLSVKLSAMAQRIEGDGASDSHVLPGLGALDQSALRDTGWYDRKSQAYSAIVNARLGRVDVTSVSGFNINSFADSYDYTWALAALTRDGIPGTGFDGFGVSGSPLNSENESRKFTQELRFTMPLGENIDWLFGAYYTKERSTYVQDIAAADDVTGAILGVGINYDFPQENEEVAAFTDFTFQLTDRFDIQLGGRQSHLKQSSSQVLTGPYVPIFNLLPSPAIYPTVDSTGSAFTYLLTPRFKINPDLMVYARLASGYRAGGPNLSPGGPVPFEYRPDRTKNYEVGLKGDFFDRRLSIDTSVYDIEWDDIQLLAVNPATQLSYNFNGGSARSRGVELSVETWPVSATTVSAWLAWNDAELTEDFPAFLLPSKYGRRGDRLPISARFSANLSLEQEFVLGHGMTGFAGGSVSYVGERLDVFKAAPGGVPIARPVLPAYAKTDLRIGVRYETWTVTALATNVTDRRGALTAGFPEYEVFYIQPRTLGLTLAKEF